MITKSSRPSPAEPTEAEIQQQAYHLRIDGGCVEGVERGNGFAAKELLLHRHGPAHGHAIRGAHVAKNHPSQST